MNSPQSTQNPLLPSRPNDARPHDHRSPSLCGRSDNVEVPAPKGEPTTRGHNSKVSLRGKDEFRAAVFPVGAYPRADGGLPPCRRGAGMGSRLQRPLHNPRRPNLIVFPAKAGTHPPSTTRAGPPSARGRLRGNDGRGKVARRWIPELWQWPKMGSRLRGKDEFRAAVFPVGAYPRADGGLPPCRRGAGMGSRLQRPLHNPRRPNLIVFPAKAGTHPCPAVDARPRLHGGRPFAGKTVIQRSLSTGRTSFGAAVFPVGACPRADGEPAPVQTGGGDGFPPSRERRVPGSRLSRGSIPSC